MSHWLNETTADETLEDDLDDLNCPADIKAKILGDSDPVFLVYPQNWDAWCAFLTVSTQLKESPVFGVLGFEYSGVESGLRMAGINTTPELFTKLRLIETEVAKQLNLKSRK